MIVADTCVVLWLAKEPEMLSKAAGEAIRAARKSGGLAISGVTLYEIAWLARKKRILFDSIDSFLADTEANFLVLPVTGAVSRRAAELPDEYPSDPMDRIIGGTAIDKGASLVTKDRAIRRSKAVEVIW